jgi:ribosome biogenesis GTPase A
MSEVLFDGFMLECGWFCDIGEDLSDLELLQCGERWTQCIDKRLLKRMSQVRLIIDNKSGHSVYNKIQSILDISNSFGLKIHFWWLMGLNNQNTYIVTEDKYSTFLTYANHSKSTVYNTLVSISRSKQNGTTKDVYKRKFYWHIEGMNICILFSIM